MDEIFLCVVSVIEVYLIWRRRDVRNEFGDVSSDWVKVEFIVIDCFVCVDGVCVVYWVYLNVFVEFFCVGDVVVFD